MPDWAYQRQIQIPHGRDVWFQDKCQRGQSEEKTALGPGGQRASSLSSLAFGPLFSG